MNNEQVPIIIKRGDMEYILTEKRLKELTEKFIELCANEATLRDDFGMNTKVVNMLIDTKKAWYPATMKSLNVNVESFDNKLALWLKSREEMNKAIKENPELVVTVENE